MPELGSETLKTLSARTGFPCVTIHTPMIRAGAQVRQNHIRLTNAANEAVDRLITLGVKSRDAEAFVHPVKNLAANDEEMEHQYDGLSVFLDDSGYESIGVPVELPPRVEVGTRFSVAHIVEPAVENIEYALLAVSRGGVGLYQCTRYTAEHVDLKGIPEDLCYVLRFDEYEKSGHVHTTSARGDAMHHGHGLGKDEDDTFVTRFVDAIEPEVTAWLRDRRIPLVIIGTEDVVGLYRKTQDYTDMVDGYRFVDPHSLSIDDIISLGWECMAPRFAKQRTDTLDRFHSAEHKAVDIYGVLPALVEGRVETLFIDPNQEIRGSFEPASESVHVDPDPARISENLVDTAVARALETKTNIVIIHGQIQTPAAIVH